MAQEHRSTVTNGRQSLIFPTENLYTGYDVISLKQFSNSEINLCAYTAGVKLILKDLLIILLVEANDCNWSQSIRYAV